MEPKDYIQDLNEQLSYLIAFARAIGELDMAGALFGEFRGEQDAGWTTAITAYEIYGEIRDLSAKENPLTRPEYRHLLSLYSQLSEAGGVYEALLNIMSTVQLKPYSMWPFQDMVRVRKVPRSVIGPNSNAMFRRLAETATAIGMTKLAKLLEVTFRDDIRNGISHADYIIADDGLRLRRRNGGYADVIAHAEVTKAISIGAMFFELFDLHLGVARRSFRPARVIVGRFSANPPMPWTVEYHDDGTYSISGKSIGPSTDAAYERQQLINNRLGGRVFTAYVAQPDELTLRLLEEVSQVGFEVLLVSLEANNRMDELRTEIETHRLWLSEPPDRVIGGVLMATPFGFHEVGDIASFRALLPCVEAVEIV